MTLNKRPAPSKERSAKLAARIVLASLVAGCAPADFDSFLPRGSGEDPATACDAGAAGCVPEADAAAPSEPDAAHDASLPSTFDAGSPDAGASACGTKPACTPMAVDTVTEACGNCKSGTRSRSRTCTADCKWGEFGSWSKCTGASGCEPGDTQPCDPVDSCGVRRCNDACAWDATCVPKPGAECVRRRVYIENGKKIVQEEGSMYMCCGDGRWSFCQPDTCQWSDSCAACSPENCEC